jgi:hypothetical protein
MDGLDDSTSDEASCRRGCCLGLPMAQPGVVCRVTRLILGASPGRLSDIVYGHLLDDAITHAVTGPGGQRGNDSDSSAAGSHSHAHSSDKALPGPVTAKPRTSLPTAS